MRNMVDEHIVGILDEHPSLRDLFRGQVWLNRCQESSARVHTRLSLKLDDLRSPTRNFVIFNQERWSVVSVRVVLIENALPLHNGHAVTSRFSRWGSPVQPRHARIRSQVRNLRRFRFCIRHLQTDFAWALEVPQITQS